MGTPAIRRGMCGGCIDFCIRQLFLELGDNFRRNGVNPRVLAAVIQPQSLQPGIFSSGDQSVMLL